ncbi:MAG: class I SAM-dependent methyltransferase [Candidatus Babeliaceae bacterium]|jgi:2-polyprenyl-3-methyl-5-hydroxy-6-metoxy-1,4-benzoquinol methylase
MEQNKYTLQICIHFHYKDWFFDIIIPKEHKIFIFSFHFFFINISITKNAYHDAIQQTQLQAPQITAEQWDKIIVESEELKIPSDEKINEMWENIQSKITKPTQIKTMKKITIKTIYLVSGMPNQGKTTITTTWVDFINRGDKKPAQYMMLDGCMLNYLNHQNNTNLSGEQISVLELIKTYNQQQLDGLRNWIFKEIDLFLQSDKTDLFIDGWLLDFYQDVILAAYSEAHNIACMKCFDYNIYVGNELYMNNNINDILPMMYIVTDDFKKYMLSILSAKTNYHYFEDIKCGNPNQHSVEKYKCLNLIKHITNKTMLDIGCNTGYNSIFAAYAAKHVTGIDISLEAIETASAYNNLVYKHANLDFYAGDFYSMSEDQQFDVILAASILHYQINDGDLMIGNFIDKCYNLLTPGGVLILECGIMPEDTSYKIVTRLSDKQTCIYTNYEHLVKRLCSRFKLIYQNNSIEQAGDKVPRFVFHFQKQTTF